MGMIVVPEHQAKADRPQAGEAPGRKRSPWLVDLPDLSFIQTKDEHGNLSPWTWEPNEEWRKLRGLLRRPGVEPSDTSVERAKDRAYELMKDAELLG